MSTLAKTEEEEVTYLCRQHTRQCMLFKQEGYPARLRHVSKIGTPAEFCNSQRFKVRHEYEADRDIVFGLMEKEMKN